MYMFVNGELAAVFWSSTPSPTVDEIHRMRNALIHSHGQPTAEDGSRMDSQGSIAKIVREVFRPAKSKNSIVCLMATSDGIEVSVTDEAIYAKHGRPSSRGSYDEAVQAASEAGKAKNTPSTIVDHLEVIRADAEKSVPGIFSVPVPSPNRTPSSPNALSPAPAEARTTMAGQKPSIWLAVAGIIAAAIVAVIVWKRKSS